MKSKNKSVAIIGCGINGIGTALAFSEKVYKSGVVLMALGIRKSKDFLKREGPLPKLALNHLNCCMEA